MNQLRAYTELASWWPLASDPADYIDEAAFARDLLFETCEPPPRTALELGSGGGNVASHLKASFGMTLTDLSAEMLAVSRGLNPECEHIQGDMRTIRLDRVFDAVFVHDAVLYMTSDHDLRMAIETAFVHCRPGGAALFVPGMVRETFQALTVHGGRDGPERGMRYLEWFWDPDPSDSTVALDFAYLLREADGSVQVVHEQHICGLFTRDVWLRLLRDVGFAPRVAKDEKGRDLFVAKRLVA